MRIRAMFFGLFLGILLVLSGVWFWSDLPASDLAQFWTLIVQGGIETNPVSPTLLSSLTIFTFTIAILIGFCVNSDSYQTLNPANLFVWLGAAALFIMSTHILMRSDPAYTLETSGGLVINILGIWIGAFLGIALPRFYFEYRKFIYRETALRAARQRIGRVVIPIYHDNSTRFGHQQAPQYYLDPDAFNTELRISFQTAVLSAFVLTASILIGQALVSTMQPQTRAEQIAQLQTYIAATSTTAPSQTVGAATAVYEWTQLAQLAATLNQPIPTPEPTLTLVPNLLATQLAQVIAAPSSNETSAGISLETAALIVGLFASTVTVIGGLWAAFRVVTKRKP